mmetsp:Transcript_53201/g.125713  ORF Transcript_53201/g.125713 Transcript_53201/m.125713 type:complete len:210 (-) Transcript_53201:734-1363(-)
MEHTNERWDRNRGSVWISFVHWPKRLFLSRTAPSSVYRTARVYMSARGMPGNFAKVLDASSSRATSSSDMRQPIAPALSSACFSDRAPGIGIAPLHITQLSATCPAVLSPLASPISLSAASSGSTSVTRSLKMLARGPDGRFEALYFPVRAPWARGEYARILTPSSSHAALTPFSSGVRCSRLYWTWLHASGTPLSASALCTLRRRFSE